nr:MAG: hypothetical protein [Bacteriophage sp.]
MRLLWLLCGGSGGLLCGGCVHKGLVLSAAFRLWEAHNAVFFGYLVFRSPIPFGKGVLIVIDIALFGKLPLILANCVPPVFFILEIFLCFFGKLQLVQFVDKIITVIFFAADSGIEPVTVKVLCKVDKVFHASGILAMCNRRRKFILVPVTLHFQKFSKIIQLVHACALDNGKRQVKGAVLRRRIPVDEKILRIVCGNADAFHSRMKLLCCGRHGKPHAARFACFKAAAAVDKN